jgi:serine/threonine protein kinase
MEYVPGGTLKDLIEKRKKKQENFTEEEISIIMKSLFKAVNALHDARVLHRDLKPGKFKNININIYNMNLFINLINVN